MFAQFHAFIMKCIVPAGLHPLDPVIIAITMKVRGDEHYWIRETSY
jgi:hypothetical protein